ncbi:hypothetical protein L915_04678 [Phytophthora nicotianae]|uniref:Uncharacterized protein n=1 Tax=Phytophthora nicotianae TaxID=4792 RepID=W2H968_PHYNI|nr:hypothetical protein L915_04678 [Phytophthora nicotianae]
MKLLTPVHDLLSTTQVPSHPTAMTQSLQQLPTGYQPEQSSESVEAHATNVQIKSKVTNRSTSNRYVEHEVTDKSGKYN